MSILAPYQIPIVQCPARFVAFEKGRRIGGSFAVGLRAALRARKGIPQHIFSASADQAADLLAMAATHLEVLDRLDPDPDSRVVDVLNTTVRLANGVELRSYADNPRAARGAAGGWWGIPCVVDTISEPQARVQSTASERRHCARLTFRSDPGLAREEVKIKNGTTDKEIKAGAAAFP